MHATVTQEVLTNSAWTGSIYDIVTFPCLAIVFVRKSVQTLSTLGTRIEEYSGLLSEGYMYSSTRFRICTHSPTL